MFLPRRASILLALSLFSACNAPNDQGKTEAYIDSGVVWAYGSIELASLDAPGIVMLSRTTTVESVNSSYGFYGAYKAAAATDATGQRSLVYGDLHPDRDRMLSYTYQLDVIARSDLSGAVDVFALLKRGGRSYWNRQRVYLGMAQFADGQTLAQMQLADGLKMSLIAEGTFAGQWALHYADAPQYVIAPWQGLCAGNVAQLPGQNPNQTVGQSMGCRALPAQQDLCNGNPTQDSCRPDAPVQQIPVQAVVGLDVLSESDGVYAMPQSGGEAKLTFVSQQRSVASDVENAQLCAQVFLALGRTIGREVNAACVLKPAPATMLNGRLTCAVTIEFGDAQTYMEKVCDVTGVFRGTLGDQQTIQVLKR